MATFNMMLFLDGQRKRIIKIGFVVVIYGLVVAQVNMICCRNFFFFCRIKMQAQLLIWTFLLIIFLMFVAISLYLQIWKMRAILSIYRRSETFTCWSVNLLIIIWDLKRNDPVVFMKIRNNRYIWYDFKSIYKLDVKMKVIYSLWIFMKSIFFIINNLQVKSLNKGCRRRKIIFLMFLMIGAIFFHLQNWKLRTAYTGLKLYLSNKHFIHMICTWNN